MLLDRNSRNLNVTNAINNNINNEIKDYQFTFDVPTGTEIQKDMKDILKNKEKHQCCLPPYVPPPLLTEIEIEIERNKTKEDFIKKSLLMSKDELDAANESADQKTKKLIKYIIDQTPGLFIDKKLNPKEQNLRNTTDNVFNLPPQVQQQLNETVFKKTIKQPITQPTPPEIIPNIVSKTKDLFIEDDLTDSFKKHEPTTINIDQRNDENQDDLVIISEDDEAKISKSLVKTDIEIKNKNNLKWKKDKNRKPYKKPIRK